MKGKVILVFDNSYRGQIEFTKNCIININEILCLKAMLILVNASVIYVGPNDSLTFGNWCNTTGIMSIKCKKKKVLEMAAW